MRATASFLQKTVYALTIVCLLLTALLPIDGAAADEVDVPWWEAGDHWRYTYNQTQWRTETIPPLSDGNGTSSTVWHNISYTIMETVIGTTTVTVHNETYDVVVVGRLQNGTASEVWGDNISLSTWDSAGNYTGGGWLGLEYLRRSDHAIVKTATVQDSEVVSSGYTNPPFVQLGFPLYAGKTWTWTGRFLTPPHHEPRNVTVSYTCLRMREVSTPAGTFDCYEISVGNRSDGDNNTLYYAPEVGNIVKRVHHSTGNVTGGTTTKELLSYSYTAEQQDEEDGSSAAPRVAWSKTYDKGDYTEGSWVEQTSDGGYIMVGASFNHHDASRDMWLMKTDGSGSEEWTQRFERNVSGQCQYVQQTPDGGYVVAASTEDVDAGETDIWLAKTDGSGHLIWNTTFGGPQDEIVNGIHQTSDGGYIVAGETRPASEQVLYGVGDALLLKVNADGSHAWNHTFGGEKTEFAASIEMASDGGYIIAGYTSSYGQGLWLVKTDEEGHMEWNNTIEQIYLSTGDGILQTHDGGYVVVGTTEQDVVLTKIDGRGNQIWSNTFSKNLSSGMGVRQTSDGGYIILAETYENDGGDKDIWLIKTSASGQETWNLTIGGAEDDLGQCMHQTADGGYIIAGTTYSYGNGIKDAWLVKMQDEQNDDTAGFEVVLLLAAAGVATLAVWKRKRR